MHAPTPHGVFAGKAAPTEQDTTFGERLLKSLVNECALGKLGTLKWTRALPDGGVVTALYDNGVARVMYDKAPLKTLSLEVAERQAKFTVPVLVSGNVLDVASRDGAPVTVHLTEGTRRRLVSYRSEYEQGVKYPKKKELFKKFVVPYGRRFKDLDPTVPDSPVMWTQYNSLYPSMYSGTMRALVQIVMGYGRQFTKAEAVEEAVGRYDRAKMSLPRSLRAPLERWVGTYDFAAHSGTPTRSGEVVYDYTVARTHAVGFDTDDKPWLIEVTGLGVFAMPLPMIPMTTSPLFRKFVEDNSDEELVAILDLFGGMPSGESFYEGEADFEAWVKAGAIIKLCEAGDFYKASPYFRSCGWAFNSRGDEAWNTCYDYADSGLQRGHTYLLALKLAEKTTTLPEKNPYTSPLLPSYLAGLKVATGALESSVEAAAVHYKLGRSLLSDLSKRADVTRGDGQRDLSYWRDLVMLPIAASSATLKRVYTGNLYGVRTKGPYYDPAEIKFPEHAAAVYACLSHDFSPTQITPALAKTRCDTIIYCYFVDDKIHYVRLFRDPQTAPPMSEDNFDDCMVVGSWTRTTKNSESVMGGRFYTTDFDPRETLSPTQGRVDILGQDLGYGQPQLEWEPHPAPMDAYLSRKRYFSTETHRFDEHGIALVNAVCIPLCSRGACLHTYQKGVGGWNEGYDKQLASITDPNSYRVWTYDRNQHWYSFRGNVYQYVQTAIDTIYGERYTPNKPLGGNGFAHWKSLAVWFPGLAGDLQNPSSITIGWVWAQLLGHPAFVTGYYPMGDPDIRPPYLGLPSPYAGDPIWLDHALYTGSPGDADCASFADEGAWMHPVADITAGVHSGQFNGEAPTFRPQAWSKTNTTGKRDGSLDLSLLDVPTHLAEQGGEGYYQESPHPVTGAFFSRAAWENSMGGNNLAVLAFGDYWHRGESTLVSDPTWPARFIGVINE